MFITLCEDDAKANTPRFKSQDPGIPITPRVTGRILSTPPYGIGITITTQCMGETPMLQFARLRMADERPRLGI